MQIANNTNIHTAARRGLVSTMVGIVKEEGLVQLYRGLAPACLRHLVYSGTRVTTYELLRENVFKKNSDGSFSLYKGIAAGMLAGGFGQFIATPTDLVKVQMQIEGKRLARVQGSLVPPQYLHAQVANRYRLWEKVAVVLLRDVEQQH